ncbi:MAG: carbohydrate binding domain-containing protein [Clostridiales Family XIII bacterium]|jgi:hypothetical protein|nr:carbohydrate binding domain-containing protein [Clostridiales Family XIII bacterium]
MKKSYAGKLHRTKRFFSTLLTICIASGLFAVEFQIAAFAASDTYVFAPLAQDDTAASVKNLVLDAPAGKYGSIISKSGHFYFSGNNQRIKFWGVNMVFSANFPATHEKADAIADDIASMGINLVRFHGIDSANGTSATIFKNYTRSTRELSDSQLEKFDYFVYALKQRGIYMDIGLNTKRQYAPDDGINVDSKTAQNAAKVKSIQYFDPWLIDLQKEFAMHLLTHVNPYTNTSYAKEPAIAMIEILNETSMYTDWGSDKFDSYLMGAFSDELSGLYNQWLVEKYGTQESLNQSWGVIGSIKGNMVSNSSFESDDLSGVRIIAKNGAKATMARSKDYQSSGAYCLRVDVTDAGKSMDDIVLSVGDITLNKGQTYAVSFDMKATVVWPAEVSISNQVARGTEGYAAATIPKAGTHCTYQFTAKDSAAQLNLIFGFGKTKGTAYIDNISVKQVGDSKTIPGGAELGHIIWPKKSDIKQYPEQALQDFSEFLQSTQRHFFNEMKDYLVNTIGSVAQISGNNLYAGVADLASQTDMDFMQNHAYFDHPLFPTGWSQSDYTMTNDDLMDSGLENAKKSYSTFLARMALCAVEDKPYVISEWGHPYPNRYEYESPLTVATFANIQDWDAMILFAYAHYDEKDDGTINYWFDIRNNPSKRAQMGAAAVSFIRGDVAPADTLISLDMTKPDTLHHGLWDMWSYDLFSGDYISPGLLFSYRLVRRNFDANVTTNLPALLGASNVKALNDSSVYRSNNVQVMWVSKSHIAIDSARTQTLVSPPKGQPVDTADMTVKMVDNSDNDSTVSLMSLDGAQIRKSERILLTIAGKQENNNAQYKWGITLSNWGNDHVNVEKINGNVNVHLTNPRDYAVYALDEAGVRLNKLSLRADQDGLTFDIGKDTMWYEIVRERFSGTTSAQKSDSAIAAAAAAATDATTTDTASSSDGINLYDSNGLMKIISLEDIRSDNGYMAIVHDGADTMYKAVGIRGSVIRAYKERYGTIPLRVVGEQVFCDFPIDIAKYEVAATSAGVNFDEIEFKVQLTQTGKTAALDTQIANNPSINRITYPINVKIFAMLPDGQQVDISSMLSYNGGLSMQDGMDQNNSWLAYMDLQTNLGDMQSAKYVLVNGKFSFETKLNPNYAYIALGRADMVKKLIPKEQIPLGLNKPIAITMTSLAFDLKWIGVISIVLFLASALFFLYLNAYNKKKVQIRESNPR